MRLFLKKFFTAPLYVLAGLGGTFGFAMVLLPLNLPYLLHVSEEWLSAVYLLLGVLFASVVAAIVRTQYLRSADPFGQHPDRCLFVRVISSREYIAEQVAFAVWTIFFTAFGGWKYSTPWQVLLSMTATLLVVGGLLFAAVDCLIWIISYKRIQR